MGAGESERELDSSSRVALRQTCVSVYDEINKEKKISSWFNLFPTEALSLISKTKDAKKKGGAVVLFQRQFLQSGIIVFFLLFYQYSTVMYIVVQLFFSLTYLFWEFVVLLFINQYLTFSP